MMKKVKQISKSVTKISAFYKMKRLRRKHKFKKRAIFIIQRETKNFLQRKKDRIYRMCKSICKVIFL